MNGEFLHSLDSLSHQDEERKEPGRDPNAVPDP
jgi:hypothetical protein